MPASPDRAPRYLLAGIVGVLIVAGYASTLWLYYPGAKTWDAKYVYQDIAKGFYGDWQSPVRPGCGASLTRSPRDRPACSC